MPITSQFASKPCTTLYRQSVLTAITTRSRYGQRNIQYKSILATTLCTGAPLAAALNTTSSPHAPSQRPSSVCTIARPFVRFYTSPAYLNMEQKQLVNEHAASKLVMEDFEKPEQDNRSYRIIKLPNELEAVLISDPDSDKASAALDNGAGSFSDDLALPGMAHAVEHLLFMGTEKVCVIDRKSRATRLLIKFGSIRKRMSTINISQLIQAILTLILLRHLPTISSNVPRSQSLKKTRIKQMAP